MADSQVEIEVQGCLNWGDGDFIIGFLSQISQP